MKLTEKVKYIFGGICTALIVIVCTAIFVYPVAISQLVGLSVSANAAGTSWNSVRDGGTQTDGVTQGMLSTALSLFNGSTYDRARGDTANGLDVDVTRLPGSNQTPADTFSNPTTFLGSWSLEALFNGSTWDRKRSASATNNTATTSLGATQITPLSTWRVIDTDVGATQSTASKAAGGGTVRHVATSITVCRGDTAVAAPALVHLRDGATGAGTIIRSWVIGISVANESKCENISGLNETGSANTAMTLEFAAAGAATSTSTVTLSGYSIP
jgi:hypothetical protein